MDEDSHRTEFLPEENINSQMEIQKQKRNEKRKIFRGEKGERTSEGENR